MDPKTQKWYGVIAAVVVIIAAAGWYFSAHNKAQAPGVNVDGAATTTDTGATGGVNGGVSVGVADDSTIPKPDLNRPYKPLASLPQSVRDNNQKLYTTAVEQLKFNPGMIAYWLQLAGLYKGANDFKGAEEVWLFVTLRWPKDPIAFSNLGDLYAYSLKQPAKAVEYWNKGIAIEPSNVRLYLALATYQDINLKDKAAATATLQAGLKANPGNTDLQYALDNLQ